MLIIASFILFLLVGIEVYFLNSLNKTSRLRNEDKQASQKISPNTKTIQEQTLKSPKMTIDKSKKYVALIKTTAGDIEITLFADKTPITVNNFIYIAKNNLYNDTQFYRIIKGRMIQGGDPTGTGTGGPGYKFNDEKFDGEYTRGTLAMANAGPNTNGSQFFIMHKDMQLAKDYVIFGKVTKGLETVDTIAEAPTEPGDRPVNPIKIESITITEE